MYSQLPPFVTVYQLLGGFQAFIAIISASKMMIAVVDKSDKIKVTRWLTTDEIKLLTPSLTGATEGGCRQLSKKLKPRRMIESRLASMLADEIGLDKTQAQMIDLSIASISSTVKVKAESELGYIIINSTDFDPALHQLSPSDEQSLSVR